MRHHGGLVRGLPKGHSPGGERRDHRSLGGAFCRQLMVAEVASVVVADGRSAGRRRGPRSRGHLGALNVVPAYSGAHHRAGPGTVINGCELDAIDRAPNRTD
jgi:hypothetical protein